MKNNIFILSFLLMTLVVPLMVQGVSTLGSPSIDGHFMSPDIQVTLLNQDPDPVQPGDVVEVRFQVQNKLSETTDDVYIEILPEFPFSMYSGESVRNFGKIRGRQTGIDAPIADFKLKVDENAVEGEYEIKLRVKIGSKLYDVYKDVFFIDVATSDAVLEMSKITLEPEQIMPGKTATLSFHVQNYDDTFVKDIRIKLLLDGTSLLPSESTNEMWISRLSSGTQKVVSFPLIAKPDASGGIAEVPVQITYEDITGRMFNKTNVISVKIGGEPRVRVHLRDREVYQSGTSGKIVVEVANPTPIDVKFLELEILPHDSYQLVSANKYVYIGDVDSDDTESETFQIFMNSGVDEVVIPVTVRYLDPQNELFEIHEELKVPVFTRSQLIRYGMQKSSMGIIIFVIIILGAGVYWWKFRRRRK